MCLWKLKPLIDYKNFWGVPWIVWYSVDELVEAYGEMASMSSGDESLRLCVFDLRRGQTEGQELDKILFFHPPELDVSTQLSVTGLSEGLITFTRSADWYTLFLIWFALVDMSMYESCEYKCRLFSPEAACEVIEAERHSHVFFEAETDIWMVMVRHSFIF